jgi:Protein O-mannosyl-transferase TMEM260-like
MRSTVGVLAAAFALAHVPYVVSSLEDIDSVNFALGIRDFDVANHRPHPPGYPVYIALGKLGAVFTRLFSGSAAPAVVEARTLSLLSLVGAIAAVFLMYRLLATLTGGQDGGENTAPPASGQPFDARALAATALAVSCPLFWYMAVRPLSDVPGLAAALASQACLALAWQRQRPSPGRDRRLNPERMAASGGMIVLGAFLAAVAIGFRSQNAVLTLPLLSGVLLDRVGRGFLGAFIGGACAFATGVLLWAVPLVMASGGWNAYLAALGSQAGEDFAGVQMLYLNPSDIRLAAFALLRTLIHPWDSLFLGGVVLALAAAGCVALIMRDRRALIAVALLALPYAGFHLLFHDTTFVRYALPLVPAIAFLAVHGVDLVARPIALPVVAVIAVWGVSVAAPVLAAYASEPSPVARVVETMQAEAKTQRPGALAMHQTFRRPLQALDVDVGPQLPSPPRREWLELAKYWREGHTEPLWFLADPQRTDIALVDPASRLDRVDIDWRFTSLSALGGMWPAGVHWYRMPAPGWFADEGWALTPEAAGISRQLGRGPSIGPITAWVRRRPGPVTVLAGGRHLGNPSDPRVGFAMAVDGTDVGRWEAAPGFFLQTFELPPDTLRGDGLARLTIRAISGEGGSIPTAIEQFDLQPHGTLMWGYDEGWHEAEYNPALGVWRWMSDRATVRIVGAASPLLVTVRVERPRRYFDDDPIVRMLAGDELLGQTTFAAGDTWSVRVPLEALIRTAGRITIETNRTFVPAEREAAPDQRRLGLRVFGMSIAAQH